MVVGVMVTVDGSNRTGVDSNRIWSPFIPHRQAVVVVMERG